MPGSCRLRLAIALAVLVLAAGAAAAVALSRAPAPDAEPVAAGHTPGHVNCKNHNHGPAWHARHTEGMGRERRRYDRSEGAPDAGPDLSRRSLTSGR